MKQVCHTIAVLFLTFFSLTPVSADTSEDTTFYFVRHAEKVSGEGDVRLSETGMERAQALLDVVKAIPMSAVYSTDFQRTQQTARPTAKYFDVPIKSYGHEQLNTERWLDQVRQENPGKNILIVGHSNTVPIMVGALSGRSIPKLDHQEYDALFIVRIPSSSSTPTKVEKHRYGGLKKTGELHFQGELSEANDISAVLIDGHNVILASDEGAKISVLTGMGDGQFFSSGAVFLPQKNELDAEALAQDENYVYILGSHSKKRKKVEPDQAKSHKRAYSKNRKRMSQSGLKPELSRHYLYRFPRSQGPIPTLDNLHKISLAEVINKDPVLAPFVPLASKENGIDIEGLASDSKSLYLGFRSPVLRGGFAPVLRWSEQQPGDNELFLLPLQGRGIRSLCRVSNGFLLIAGPSGESNQGFRLYHWDGRDCLPGKRPEADPNIGELTLLGTIPSPNPQKAEGLELLEETDEAYEILVVYDGVKNGRPTSYKVNKAEL